MPLICAWTSAAESRRGCVSADVQAATQHTRPVPISNSDIEFIAAGSWEEPEDFIDIDLTAMTPVRRRNVSRYNDANDRHVGLPDDDYWGREWADATGQWVGSEESPRTHSQLVASARARRLQQAPPQDPYVGSVHSGGQARRPGGRRARVTFGGSGQTTGF